MLCSRVRSDGGDARKQHSSPKSQVTSHQSLATSPSPLHCLSYRFVDPSCAFGAPLLQGLLVWHVIPCFRFSSCTFTRIRVRQRAHGFASVDDTEWRFAQLAYWSLRRRVPLRGTSILRLWRGPFGFIGRRLSGQARRLFG